MPNEAVNNRQQVGWTANSVASQLCGPLPKRYGLSVKLIIEVNN